MTVVNLAFREDEIKHKRQILEAIRPHVHKLADMEVHLASTKQDMNESFDLVVYIDDIPVSVRIRDVSALQYRDVTIRSKTIMGNPTEIDKIKAGMGKVYFYGWETQDKSSIQSYVLFNIDKMRHLLDMPRIARGAYGQNEFIAIGIKELHDCGSVIFDSEVDTLEDDPKQELLNADCMEYMKGQGDNSFDLAIVDPPYGIGINSSGRLGHYGGKGKTWDDSVPDASYFMELMRVSRNQIIWGGNYFNLPPNRCFLIWDKLQPVGVSFADAEYAWTSFDESARAFRKRPMNADIERIHPTQKPVDLYEWILGLYAKKGDKILDTHLGSGSIAIAANRLGFSLVGTEIDKDYHLEAMRRFNDATKQGDLF